LSTTVTLGTETVAGSMENTTTNYKNCTPSPTPVPQKNFIYTSAEAYMDRVAPPAVSRAGAFAAAVWVFLGVAVIAAVPALFTHLSEVGIAIFAVVGGLVAALGLYAAWTLGRLRLHGYFLAPYFLALASAAAWARPLGLLLAAAPLALYIAGAWRVATATEEHWARRTMATFLAFLVFVGVASLLLAPFLLVLPACEGGVATYAPLGADVWKIRQLGYVAADYGVCGDVTRDARLLSALKELGVYEVSVVSWAPALFLNIPPWSGEVAVDGLRVHYTSLFTLFAFLLAFSSLGIFGAWALGKWGLRGHFLVPYAVVLALVMAEAGSALVFDPSPRYLWPLAISLAPPLAYYAARRRAKY